MFKDQNGEQRGGETEKRDFGMRIISKTVRVAEEEREKGRRSEPIDVAVRRIETIGPPTCRVQQRIVSAVRSAEKIKYD